MKKLFKIILVLLLFFISLTPVLNTPFFTKQANAESCEYYIYDPTTSRFLPRDPVRGVLTDSQTQNPYAYSMNNPINMSDPSGECVGPIGSTICSCLTTMGTKLWPAAQQAPKVINGILYGEHALGRMEPVGMGGRGIPPSVVQNAIDYGIKTPGNIADRIVHTYENVVVVTDKLIKEVITVYTTGH